MYKLKWWHDDTFKWNENISSGNMNFTVIYSTNDSSGHATSTISQFDLIFFLIPKGLLCLCQIKTLEVIMEYKHEDKMIILHQITFIWQTRLSNLEWSIDCFVPKMYITQDQNKWNNCISDFCRKELQHKVQETGPDTEHVCVLWVNMGIQAVQISGEISEWLQMNVIYYDIFK